MRQLIAERDAQPNQPMMHTAGPTHHSLPDWIQRARSSISKEEYIECAVFVALELTNHLRTVVGVAHHEDGNLDSSLSAFNSFFSSWDESADDGEDKTYGAVSRSSVRVRIEDIVPENVIVTSCAKNYTATEVIFKPATSELSDRDETPQLSQKSVCLALGKILFELFSQGDPFFLVDLPSNVDSSEDPFSSLLGSLGLNEDDAPIAPAMKKSFLSQTFDASPMSPQTLKAKAYLEEQGMPLSICRLVSDLLGADEENGDKYVSDTALVSLEETRIDLLQIHEYPHRFLHDRTCSTTANESTSLFDQMDGELYGREKELGTLMDAAARVSFHQLSSRGNNMGVLQSNDFECEAIFLSGHSGAGKSSIIKKLVCYCTANDWAALFCKFDRQISPLSSVLQSLDSFFGQFILDKSDLSGQKSLVQISASILTSINSECLGQLCQLLPNLRSLFPMAEIQNSTPGDFFANINDGVGSGSNRLCHLFHLIFKAICGGGYPVVIVFDDLQWSDAFTMRIMEDLIQSTSNSSAISVDEGSSKGGLLLLGSFRDNEVEKDGFLMNQIKALEHSRGGKVSRLFVGELPEHEINKMLSFKLCLPMRYTRMLAQLVHQKTRGNPLYCVEFLKAIIKERVLSYSVKNQRWTWDDTCIDMRTMSEGVVHLLTRKLMLLPHDLVDALKVASCLGQINLSTIALLDLGWFVPNLLEALELAVQEGILEKAGPLFAFSHDMLQESTYQLISKHERKTLHKKIGMSLVQDPEVADNAELCAAAVDQINLCTEILDPVERALFARLNLVAGKHSIAASNFEQARGYFESGLLLLHANPWQRQYSLCMELHEMSVIVSYMDGKIEVVSSRLDSIVTNASFDDALNSRALQAKLLASQQRFSEAVNVVLAVLSHFGEEFPRNASLAYVTSETKAMIPMMEDITKEEVLRLKPMTDKTKLNAMKFMDLLVTICLYYEPMVVPLVACRMIKMAMELGYSEDTIPALAHMTITLLHYSDDVQLAARIGRLAESLILGNPQEHSLRARIIHLYIIVRFFVEPWQAIPPMAQDGYNSARITGDFDNAMLSLVVYSISNLFAIPDLVGLHKKMISVLHQMAKHKRIGMLISAMAYFNTVTALIGNEDSPGVNPSIGLKTHKEIFQIAEHTHNTFLMHHVIVSQMYVDCYFREYISVTRSAEKYELKTQAKRVMDFFFVFFRGIAAMSLGRDAKHPKWREIGEKSVKTMTHLLEYSTWNFENKLMLLKAELHYLDGRNTMAEVSYQAAIVSARDHRFYHEEALGLELYGIFLVENKKIVKGLQQLRTAMKKYISWGALKKADAVLDLINLVTQTLQTWRV